MEVIIKRVPQNRMERPSDDDNDVALSINEGCALFSFVICCAFSFGCADSVQKSLERKFARRGGTIPVTPSEHFEQRIAVSTTSNIFQCSFLFKC